jgi:hypothetical protein
LEKIDCEEGLEAMAVAKEDVRTLKTLAREKTKTTAIARKLKRTERATYQKALCARRDVGGRPEEDGVRGTVLFMVI